VHALAWITVLALFAGIAYVFAGAGLAMKNKSQLLKCHAHLIGSSVEIGRPGVGALLHGKLASTLRATIEVTNPTSHDVAFEDSRLEISRGGALVASAALNAGKIPAGETVKYPIEAPVVLSASELRHALEHVSAWAITLYVRVAPGVELPVYIKAAAP